MTRLGLLLAQSKLGLAAILLSTLIVVEGCGGGGGSSDSTARGGVRSVARVWDEAALDAIRIDTPRPPVHARNLWHMSVAMYDAWAAYDSHAVGYLAREKHTAKESGAPSERDEAVSYAAYRVLKNRYALSVNAATTLPALDQVMSSLGYDPSVTTVDGDSAAAVGNRIAEAVIAFGNTDGSNQAGNYADTSFSAANSPLIVAFPGNIMEHPNEWQPLALQVAFTQNGLPLPSGLQSFVGSQWGGVLPFALERGRDGAALIQPGEPPQIGGASDDEFKREMLDVLAHSSVLSPDLPAMIDISPGAYGNNSLGANDGHGRTVNPVTGEAYEPQLVRLGDFARVLAEYWADGPRSETPPGHWNVLANSVSDDTRQQFLFEGTGDPLDRLAWDVKLYFALNGALHDAAINSWGLKRRFQSVRPISAIRYMATRGQSSDPASRSYDPQGLPLVEGLSELITTQTWPSGRHAGIRCCTSLAGTPAPCVDSAGNAGIEVSCVGEVAVLAWAGQPADRATSVSGVRWIRAKDWSPYQLDTFVTPAFPGFNSGHSTFSRAAAEVLAAFTGSEFFPGGLGSFRADKNHFLTFELGPSSDIQLEWATYFDAADQAGQSRLYGGIHILADDLTGRTAGAQIGRQAFAKAKGLF